MKKQIVQTEGHVGYSRAGDVFHYRWAARRCLQLMYPNSNLQFITIESSNENKLIGEYVIDVAEYYESNVDASREVIYYQLKHTTKRKEKLFTLSELKTTIEGFSKRYSELLKRNSSSKKTNYSFSIITNRPISENMKANFSKMVKNEVVNKKFKETLELYSKLKGKQLANFCSRVKFQDGEGDYTAQRYELHKEMSQIIAGAIDNLLIDQLVALVQDRVLPHSNHKITKENVLEKFGVTSEHDLYPAPPQFDSISNIFKREQHDELLGIILETSDPIIIHANGGVGKTVVANQLAGAIPLHSVAIVYDCFGNGSYMNRSETRHRYKDALVQIANELAEKGLCEPLIVFPNTPEDVILRDFISKIKKALNSIKKLNKDAKIFLFVDAADNAELAAQMYGDPCFANELLKESLPYDCRLIELCRTERIHYLKPAPNVIQIELKPFSEKETSHHLKTKFPTASNEDVKEFHRLSNDGNPRVQAYALSIGNKLIDILNHLGPSGRSVDDQIERQIEAAITNAKKKLPHAQHTEIETICRGLAILPPLIPLQVLSSISGVDKGIIKSFIAELGRPLRLSDSSVQFRDEPTETWFRKTYSADNTLIVTFIERIKPMSEHSTYVAETLPHLLLLAGEYDSLINLSLSDDNLPESNSVDKRNVRLYRLKFAFKAALKANRFVDAAKLALRTGEELAGNKRQLVLLQNNLDLIAPILNEQKVKELAFRRRFKGAWNGSENVYSASLLSTIKDYHSDSRAFLRSANQWLNIYLENRKKDQNDYSLQQQLTDHDIVELLFTHYNLFGVDSSVQFLLSWRPNEILYRISRPFIKRLIDLEKYKDVEAFAQSGSGNNYLILAVCIELLDVGRTLKSDLLESSLKSLSHTKINSLSEIPYGDNTHSAIINFAEACAINKISATNIILLLNKYFTNKPFNFIADEFDETRRRNYLRSVALRNILLHNYSVDVNKLVPNNLLEKKNQNDSKIREFKEVVGGLLPWYLLRTRVMLEDDANFPLILSQVELESKNSLSMRWREHDRIPYELARILTDILIFMKNSDHKVIEKFYSSKIKTQASFDINNRLKLLRSINRLDHLKRFNQEIENITYEFINSIHDETPDAKAGWYLDLARAVYNNSITDASEYFNDAINIVSKFGDEVVERWNALVSLANLGTKSDNISNEIAYRFIRCAEQVGETVSREKYWRRDEAIRTCFRLSPNTAFAALSRWRDRDVGWFGSLIYSIMKESIDTSKLPVTLIWSLFPFIDTNLIDDLACLCIANLSERSLQQKILDEAIYHLLNAESEEINWNLLREIAIKYSLVKSHLDEIIEHKSLKKQPSNNKIVSSCISPQVKSEKKNDWGQIFSGIELFTSDGIDEAILHFQTVNNSSDISYEFWQQIYRYVTTNEIVFIKSLIQAQRLTIYNLRDAIHCMPTEWKNKISVKRNWPSVTKQIGLRFASYLSSHYSLEYFLDDQLYSTESLSDLKDGILEGLSHNSDLTDAVDFFGFIEIIVPRLGSVQAIELLSYGLERFEIHIQENFADGLWSDWLTPHDTLEESIIHFVWAALGAPQSDIRWRAAHCIRTMANYGHIQELRSFIAYLDKNDVGAFGGKSLPFYTLHARLYLLVALSRISIDNSAVLKNFSNVFVHYSLETEPHILIQKYASEIALNIEKQFPLTFEDDIKKQLQLVCTSQLTPQSGRRRNALGSKKESDENFDKEFFFAFDFDRYWFEPLGRIFGLSSQAVQKLAYKIIKEDWLIDFDGAYRSDPRNSIWNSSYKRRANDHSHGSYPRTDDYSFYLSYHSLLSVAVVLLKTMPIINEADWDRNYWEEWIENHSLSLNDGRWFSDRRDPVPLERRSWYFAEKVDSWRTEIADTDFLDAIFWEKNGAIWLNVNGRWEESDSSRREDIHLSTALVSYDVSKAILHAFSASTDRYFFNLPMFEEADTKDVLSPFVFKEWIVQKSSVENINSYDPFSGEISYPPIEIEQTIIKSLNLKSDPEGRYWFQNNETNPSLVCEIWSSNIESREEFRDRCGNRLSASFELIKKLCYQYKSELLIKVEINRHFKRGQYKRNYNASDYTPPKFKIFVLSPKGRLRDDRKNYKFRENSR
jgi:hypothetical protein